MLPRLRHSFAVFTALVAIAGLTQLGAAPVGGRLLVSLSLVGLLTWAALLATWRTSWWLDLLVVLPLSGLAVGLGDWWVAFPVLHVVIFQRALHGATLRAYGGALLVAGLPLTVAGMVGGTPVGWPHLLLLPSVLVSTWLLRQVRLLAEQVELVARREKRLLSASQQMAAAYEQHEVDRVVVRAALDLLEQSDARSTLWEEQGDEWVAVVSAGPSRLSNVPKLQLPEDMVGRAAIGEPWVLKVSEAALLQTRLGLEPHYRAFVFVPLNRPHGPQAVLGLSCPTLPDPALPEVLRRFAHEIALAQDRARLVAEVATRESRLASIVEGSADIIAQLDADGHFTMINQATTKVHGYLPEDLIGTSVFDLIVEEDRGYVLRTTLEGDLEAGVHLAHRLYDADGEIREVESHISRPPSERGGYILNTRDVTTRKALEAELVYRAHHDALTGLANRGAFTDRLEAALDRSRRHDVPVGLIMLDLNDFKPVNDTYGHHAGDEVLVAIADRLRDGIRTTDLAARMGGDEFAVILEQAGDTEEVWTLAERLEASIVEPIALSTGHSIRVSACMGLASSRADTDADELLREADQHLCVSKRARHRERARARLTDRHAMTGTSA